jgi:phosphorylase kinase alpha/beta subunit
MYFFVSEDNIEFEKQEPGSQVRQPSSEGSGVKGMFLWNQAMFVIAQLLTAGLLHINELDPVRRYLPSYNRPRKGGRYSAFQVSMVIFGAVFYRHSSSVFSYTDISV